MQELKILIVDDDEDDIVLTKELISEGMKGASLSFYEAHNFKEAVSIVDKDSYDLCIFDYRLNEIHGLDLLRTVRTKGIMTPVIFLTGQGEEDIAVDAMKSGATDYIVKGKMSSDSLCSSIRYALELHKKEELNRKMEEELKKISKLEAIGALAGGIAHEFNNLLTGVLGNISLAKMFAKEEDEIFKNLSEAEKASLRAKDIAQQLLTFSRGGAPIKKKYSISEFIKESACLFLKSSNILCDCSLSDNLYPVEIDEGQMKHAIANILINAKEAMPEGGMVKIYAENIEADAKYGLPLKDGKYVKISIEDTGTGIPEKYLDRIFDPFFTTKEKKSGIGLSTAYSIVKKHNGYITAESKAGIGTTIYIYLPAITSQPLTHPHPSPLPEGEGEKGKGRGNASGRVLVMDDEEIIRDVACKMLKRIGYEADFAKDGIEAIELYKKAMKTKQPYCIVIMDLTIPGGMGGKETIKKLREIDPSVKAIVSSGYSDDAAMSEFKEYGFNGVIAKPYSVKELGEIVERVCRKDS